MIYNASGERTWKLTGYEQQMWINGQTVVNIVNFAKTLYASPYMVMNEKEYTKHYYAGSERVCTKIGSGFSLAPTAPVGTQAVEAINEQNPEEISNGLWTMVARGIECAEFNPAYVMIDKKLEPAYNMGEDAENDRYFYHPDHTSTSLSTGLGSSAFITDVAGHAVLQFSKIIIVKCKLSHRDAFGMNFKF